MKKLQIIAWGMALCSLFGAGGALIPGAAESMGVSQDLLVHAPFKTFFIPGLFLLVILFGGNMLSGLLLGKGSSNGPYVSGGMGGITLLWILAQWVLMGAIFPIQMLFFALASGQLLLSWHVIRKNRLPLPFAAKEN